MNRWLKLAAPLLATLAIAACSASGTTSVPASSGTSQTGSVTFKHVPQWAARHEARAACPQVVGRPTCLALQVLKGGIVPQCSPTTCGFTPQQLQTAYGLTKKLKNGSGTTVAVIEVGDLANATSDLATYRSQFGLGTANMVKVNEEGQQSDYPPSCENYGWCLETDLDIDMVSAACPKCNIMLMEAGGNFFSDLATAEAEAVTLGATILSNSWICYGSSNCQISNFSSYFDTPGITYLAGSGDAAYDNIGAPSALDSVIAVGGTQLEVSGSGFTESIWDDAGAGCADAAQVGTAIPKPSWQHDPGCTSRTDSDISAQSGCSPGVSVYSGTYGGWTGVCGTSVAGPLLAGVVALAGNASSQNGAETIWQITGRQRPHRLHNITSGNDGSCGGSYLCTAGTHQYKTYSGPGGWGSPKTIRAL
ncbi:MAG: hypothetical protein WB615_03420 [Candidatus Tumulicola sp.]